MEKIKRGNNGEQWVIKGEQLRLMGRKKNNWEQRERTENNGGTIQNKGGIMGE